MRARLRSICDRVVFLAQAEWVYLIGLLGIVIGLAPLLPGWPRWASVSIGISGVLVSVAMFTRDTRALSKRFSKRVLTQLNPLFAVVPMDPSLVPREYQGRGTMLVDPTLDRLLYERGSELTVTGLADQFELPPDLRELAPYVLSKTTGAKWPFNDLALRLVTDLDAASFGRDLQVQPVSYFDFLCSNELMKWRISHRGSTDIPLRRHLLDSRGGLLQFSESRLANIIGVSTVAYTTDGHLLMVLQTSGNTTSGGLRAPSGSGSLDKADLLGVRSLADLVEAGAVREMREETGMPAQLIGETRLSGYARWLDRGAKPEFFAFTELLGTKAEVMSALGRLDSREHIYTAGVEWIAMADAVSAVSHQHELTDTQFEFLQLASLPLLLALEKYALVVNGVSDEQES